MITEVRNASVQAPTLHLHPRVSSLYIWFNLLFFLSSLFLFLLFSCFLFFPVCLQFSCHLLHLPKTTLVMVCQKTLSVFRKKKKKQGILSAEWFPLSEVRDQSLVHDCCPLNIKSLKNYNNRIAMSKKSIQKKCIFLSILSWVSAEKSLHNVKFNSCYTM